METINEKNIRSIREQLFKMNSNLTRVIIQPVQKQKNGIDCGIFSLAFATSICHKSNPSKCWYDRSKLRDHFNKCVETDKVEEFPQKVFMIIDYFII